MATPAETDMGNRVFPIPADTPMADTQGGGKFGMIWIRFLKAISDVLMAATIETTHRTIPAFKWCLNSGTCFCTYYTVTPSGSPVAVSLPYTANDAFLVGATAYPPGSTSVTIPAGAGTVQFWYIITPSNN